ncbi:septum site-determining protein MinC [Solimicrobium silvestre]|uniref:Probable septum site-determining protein MinC n=1 Tax=Solimicrobium silvestre TaxID=2099400 RepID=A0A2S9H2P0_9BURK|nr:septum site-determining protein MinC [Solimicrobium silvestre]PRC94227.1 minC: septum site-determining protein MinC [Solimicrobium silvestre]
MLSKNQRKPIEIKISTVVAIAVILFDADLTILEAAIKELTANSSDYYSEECAVIDVANIDCTDLDWAALIKLLKTNGINPVAVRNAPASSETQISLLGLSIDLGSKTAPLAEVATAPIPAPTPIPTPITASSLPPMIIDTPVRGGQRIYARGTDLIITAVVNSGAEVIADGSIHIYAPLRGRALAGASGNTAARIFTLSLEAELVSIAGIYRTFENGYPSLTPNAPLQIKLNGDRIDVVSIQIAK